jgi:hypothetical protein
MYLDHILRLSQNQSTLPPIILSVARTRDSIFAVCESNFAQEQGGGRLDMERLSHSEILDQAVGANFRF